MIEYPHSQFSFCFIFRFLSSHFPNNQMENISSKKNENYDVITTICRRIWKHKDKTNTKTKEEHLESDIVIGLIREQKRTRDLLLQFDWREKKNKQKNTKWKQKQIPQTWKNKVYKTQTDRNEESVTKILLTGELELQRLDAEKLARAHWIDCLIDLVWVCCGKRWNLNWI